MSLTRSLSLFMRIKSLFSPLQGLGFYYQYLAHLYQVHILFRTLTLKMTLCTFFITILIIFSYLILVVIIILAAHLCMSLPYMILLLHFLLATFNNKSVFKGESRQSRSLVTLHDFREFTEFSEVQTATYRNFHLLCIGYMWYFTRELC